MSEEVTCGKRGRSHEDDNVVEICKIAKVESYIIPEEVGEGDSKNQVKDDDTPQVLSANDSAISAMGSCDTSTTTYNTSGCQNEASARELSEDYSIELSDFYSDILVSSPDSAVVDHTFFDLPIQVKEILRKERKIENLYDWQDRLMRKLLESDKNVIYCVPTSGGKTLVAELLLMKELLVNRKDAIFVLPFISIVQEKIAALQPFAESLGFIIEEYAGPKGPIPIKTRKKFKTIYVCTIEKVNVVFAYLHETMRLNEIGLMVIDEFHMIGDGTARGATLEAFIIKIKLAAEKAESSLRILAMSATLADFSKLKDFLEADVEKESFRPVQLREYIKAINTKNNERVLFDITSGKYGGKVDWEHVKIVRRFPDPIPQDPDDLRILVGECMPSKSVLVFCPSKDQCKNLAKLLCSLVPQNENLTVKREERKKLIQAIKNVNNGNICPILNLSLTFGIAYHHSGLTYDERTLIESAFLNQVICVICCTSTLAAGVNLPAERVIIRDPRVGSQFLSRAQYQQMIGRAGRAGLCESGESILICNKKDSNSVKKLVESSSSNCRSTLLTSPNSLSSFILSLCDLNLATTVEEVKDIICTKSLYSLQNSKPDVTSRLATSITELTEQNLIEVMNRGDQKDLTITPTGRGVVRGLINVDQSNQIKHELLKAVRELYAENYLHLIYLVTLLVEEEVLPREPEPSTFLDACESLSKTEKESLPKFGVCYGDIQRYSFISGNPSINLRRFYLVLIIYEVYKHRDIMIVAHRFHLERGTLNGMLQQAATAANSLLRFVDAMQDEFWAIKNLLPQVCNALTYCCSPELMGLLQLPGLKIPRARQLYNAGFVNIRSIAVLKKPQEITSKIDKINKHQAGKIITAARHFMKGVKDELEIEVEMADVPDLSDFDWAEWEEHEATKSQGSQDVHTAQEEQDENNKGDEPSSSNQENNPPGNG